MTSGGEKKKKSLPRGFPFLQEKRTGKRGGEGNEEREGKLGGRLPQEKKGV